MCNRYPECDHAGPLLDKVDGIDRHCETTLPNDTCRYLAMGCKGCSFAIRQGTLAVNPITGKSLGPVDWANWARKHSGGFGGTIHLRDTRKPVDGQGAIIFYAAMMMPDTNKFLQRMVEGGLCSQEWANKTLINAALHLYRTLIYRRLLGYINQQIEAEALVFIAELEQGANNDGC